MTIARLRTPSDKPANMIKIQFRIQEQYIFVEHDINFLDYLPCPEPELLENIDARANGML